MPCILTTVHDAVALAATCRRDGLPPPQERCVQLDHVEVFGWSVCLPGLHAVIVVNTLTGLVAYHPRDNAFGPYGRIMRFILFYYDVRAALRRCGTMPIAQRRETRRRRRLRVECVA